MKRPERIWNKSLTKPYFVAFYWQIKLFTCFPQAVIYRKFEIDIFLNIVIIIYK